MRRDLNKLKKQGFEILTNLNLRYGYGKSMTANAHIEGTGRNH